MDMKNCERMLLRKVVQVAQELFTQEMRFHLFETFNRKRSVA